MLCQIFLLLGAGVFVLAETSCLRSASALHLFRDMPHSLKSRPVFSTQPFLVGSWFFEPSFGSPLSNIPPCSDRFLGRGRGDRGGIALGMGQPPHPHRQVLIHSFLFFLLVQPGGGRPGPPGRQFPLHGFAPVDFKS